jgi:threonine synthase
MTGVFCTQCGKPYPDTGTPFRCECGGIFDFLDFPKFNRMKIDHADRSLWRYRAMLGLEPEANPVTLGEGNTDLVILNEQFPGVYAKLEYQNPTASYKDRGTAVLASFLYSRQVEYAVEDSSGNAGASFAAYAARAGLRARVYVPEAASGPKRSQIEAYGAELVAVAGARSNAAEAVQKEAYRGAAYASHAFMPFGLTGIATIAYEIVDQLGEAPGTVISPVGHGGLLYGMMRGFQSMSAAGIIMKEPYYLGVQSGACNPVVRAYRAHFGEIQEEPSGETVAEGVKVSNPARGRAILSHIQSTGGKIMDIEDKRLLQAYHDLARMGFYCEPTSALTYAALQQEMEVLPKPVVLVLTGAGVKTKIL